MKREESQYHKMIDRLLFIRDKHEELARNQSLCGHVDQPPSPREIVRQQGVVDGIDIALGALYTTVPRNYTNVIERLAGHLKGVDKFFNDFRNPKNKSDD